MAGRSYNQPWCPMARFLDLFGERWTLLVVRELLFAHPEPRRFGELLGELPGMSRSLLMSRLRELEAAGIVTPHDDGTARAIGGWGLTERGASLAPVMREIAHWSHEEIEDPSGAPRAAIRRKIATLG